MRNRRHRLSIEALEDRTNPGSLSELNSLAVASYMTTSEIKYVVDNFAKQFMGLDNAAAKPLLQSFFTNVFNQAQETLVLANEFPNSSAAAIARPFAELNRSFALEIGNLAGFNVKPPASPKPPAKAGAANPAHSTVSLSPTTVAVGGTASVTLTAKDVHGIPLTTGGATVTFGIGVGAGQGSFGTVTDNHNGTYTATFTATTIGTNTITATLNSQAVTSTAPTVTIVGTPSPAQSVVSVSPASIAANGTSTITLTAKDANGTALTTGGATVTFALGAGTAQGTIGAVTDKGNGTYTATFTGTTTGTNTITATLNSQAVTSTAPTITVLGPADPAHSTVSLSPASITNGGTSTVTLTAKDANGDPLTTGGATVVFSLGAGTTLGTFGTVTDNANGTYTATFTATTTGTNTVTATFNGQAVTTPPATLTVVGPVDLSQTSVSVAPASVESGGTTTVTLTAKDSSGNQEPSGGLTVLFSLGLGTGQGTFGAVTDNGNGTYTATLTGSTVGTNTITATVGGSAVTSTAPTVTVVAPPDPTQSLVDVAPSSIASGGTAFVTLTALDSTGSQVPVGGSTVVFSLGNGTAQGTFGTVTDNGDGTYSANFTGTIAGTNTITATIGGQAVTTTAPTITVTPGTASPAQSTVTAVPTSIPSGSTSTVKLTAKDSGGNQLASGGSTVVFALASGTAIGTFGTVTDNGDGTYSATFTGTAAGTNSVTATIDGQALTSTMPTLTVTAISGQADPGNSLVSLAPTTINSGGTSIVTLTAKDSTGTQLTTGGATVVFSLGNDTASGTFGTVTDNANGTYTATFTATGAGTNTVTATINGVALTSTAPTITVNDVADPAQSLVTTDVPSIQSGDIANVTLTANDVGGNQLTTGGSTVVFSLGSGVGKGTFSTVTDNGDGTYSATFTGTIAGSNTITATIDGHALTSAPADIAVTPGDADMAHTIVAVAPPSIANAGTATITLTAKDASGNQLDTGGSLVDFALGTGAGQGTIGTVTDNGDGTYTATFTATVVGSNTITATLDAQAVTSTPPTIRVN
jgi:adhesin/invasin